MAGLERNKNRKGAQKNDNNNKYTSISFGLSGRADGDRNSSMRAGEGLRSLRWPDSFHVSSAFHGLSVACTQLLEIFLLLPSSSKMLFFLFFFCYLIFFYYEKKMDFHRFNSMDYGHWITQGDLLESVMINVMSNINIH